MTDDLTTAGVAPQVPNQNETKSGNNFVSLDPEKVARSLGRAEAAWLKATGPETRVERMARALCEAYTEGKLT